MVIRRIHKVKRVRFNYARHCKVWWCRLTFDEWITCQLWMSTYVIRSDYVHMNVIRSALRNRQMMLMLSAKQQDGAGEIFAIRWCYGFIIAMNWHLSCTSSHISVMNDSVCLQNYCHHQMSGSTDFFFIALQKLNDVHSEFAGSLPLCQRTQCYHARTIIHQSKDPKPSSNSQFKFNFISISH